jgi:hypothetical protein
VNLSVAGRLSGGSKNLIARLIIDQEIDAFPPENRPRRNEGYEGRTEEIFVFFVVDFNSN